MDALTTNNHQSFDANTWMKNLEATIVTNPLTEEFVRCSIYKMEKGSLVFSPKLEKTVEKILNTKPTRDLLNEALADGPINILPGNQYNTPTGSIWMHEWRTILLDNEKNDNFKSGALLLGIAEALNAEFQKKVAEESHRGLIDRENFVKLSQRLGFETAKRFHDIVTECILKHQWPRETDLKMSLFLKEIKDPQGEYSWEEYWKRTRNSEHSELIRNNWDQVFRGVYCINKPKSKDCLE